MFAFSRTGLNRLGEAGFLLSLPVSRCRPLVKHWKKVAATPVRETAQTSAQPERAGINREDDLSAVGAAPVGSASRAPTPAVEA